MIELTASATGNNALIAAIVAASNRPKHDDFLAALEAPYSPEIDDLDALRLAYRMALSRIHHNAADAAWGNGDREGYDAVRGADYALAMEGDPIDWPAYGTDYAVLPHTYLQPAWQAEVARWQA